MQQLIFLMDRNMKQLFTKGINVLLKVYFSRDRTLFYFIYLY